MKTISPYHTALLFVALSPFISGDAPVVCPADCSKCPTNGAYSVSGNMYYCTDQKQCPCNLAGSGCPILCSQCPLGNFDTKDMGGGIELTFCVDMVGESACSCISPPLAPLVPVNVVSGWGGIHFIQYQKQDPDVTDQTPDGAYHLDVRMFDSATFANGTKRTPSLIGAVYGATAFGGKAITVNNTTPWPLTVTSPEGSVDADGLVCSFNGATWKTDQQPQCNMGHTTDDGYEDGKRNGDCGFSIPVITT